MQDEVIREVVALNKAAMHGALDALEKALSGAEQIARHQLASAWSMIHDTIDGAGAPVDAVPDDALDAWRNDTLQPLVLKFLEDSRRHFELSVLAQRQVSEVAEAQFADFAMRSAQTIERLSLGRDDTMTPLLDTVRRSVEISATTLDEMRQLTRELAMLAAVGATTAGVHLQPVDATASHGGAGHAAV